MFFLFFTSRLNLQDEALVWKTQIVADCYFANIFFEQTTHRGKNHSRMTVTSNLDYCLLSLEVVAMKQVHLNVILLGQ